MHDQEKAGGCDALDVDPEDLAAEPGPLQVVDVCGNDRQVHDCHLQEGVPVQLLVEPILKIEGA